MSRIVDIPRVSWLLSSQNNQAHGLLYLYGIIAVNMYDRLFKLFVQIVSIGLYDNYL